MNANDLNTTELLLLPPHILHLPRTPEAQRFTHDIKKFEEAEQGLSTFNSLHFGDFCPQVYGLVNKSFSNYAGMAHFLIESQVPLF